MARRTRLFVAGIPYHIVQRGNNKCPLFLSPADYTFFLEVLQDARLRYPCFIYAFCLMSNHFHLLARPENKGNVSLLMKPLGVRYVQYINNKYGRTGTLWEGRFKASLIDEEMYFITCLHYIEMNPVRANIVSHPELYHWSSYRFRAFGERNVLIKLDLDPWYSSLGVNVEECKINYRQLFQNPLPEAMLSRIRETTNKDGILGNGRLTNQIENITHKKIIIRNTGRPKLIGSDPEL